MTQCCQNRMEPFVGKEGRNLTTARSQTANSVTQVSTFSVLFLDLLKRNGS